MPLEPRLLNVTRDLCDEKNIEYEIMPSGAGHDAMQMAKITDTAMIFIPSKRGISHNPLEWSAPADIALGTQLLMEAMVRIANGEENLSNPNFEIRNPKQTQNKKDSKRARF